jgi:hypothetical protein
MESGGICITPTRGGSSIGRLRAKELLSGRIRRTSWKENSPLWLIARVRHGHCDVITLRQAGGCFATETVAAWWS